MDLLPGAVALVHALTDGQAEENVETLGDKLVQVEAEALVDTMAHRLALVQ